MIYTVTLNPALDKTVEIPNLALDTVNRITKMRTDPGGKGINVSKVIAKLGGTSKAIGILAGNSGKAIQDALDSEGLAHNFRFVPGETRTNLKVIDPENHTNTDINEPGLTVTAADLDALLNDLLDEVFLSEERHRTIAELSDNMLFEWDFHKERMYCSPNMLAKFDIKTEDSTLSNGKFIDSLMNSEDAEKYKRDINQLLKNKNGYSAEYQLKTKSGAVIWVSLRAVCITDRLGEPLRVIGVMTDIDNEKKLELQLSERASYDFLSQL